MSMRVSELTTLERVRAYNREYSARPEVKEWAKVRNARPERKATRKAYKKSVNGKEAERRYQKKNWAKNAPLREKQLLWRYGLTPESFNELLEKQNNLCAICFKPSKQRLHIDHSHETGLVRGLLCGNCNRAIGLFKDDCEVMRNAIKYLYGEC